MPDAAPTPAHAPHEDLAEIRTADLPSRTLWRVQITAAPEGTLNWEPLTVEQVAPLFPQFEILTLIGRGGMGAVYMGRQVHLDRYVAIKLLPPELSAAQKSRDRFAREAKAMARLNHPRIVTVFDYGETAENHLFIVMEYVDGYNLQVALEKRNMTPAESLRVASEICEGLTYAHARGVVHRDIKPGNILLDRNGSVKIADFGIARLVESQDGSQVTTRASLGTPAYMSPEQLDGAPLDHRCDIYALGVVLYELCSWQLPRGNFQPLSTMQPGIAPLVDMIVRRALQPVPDQRYQQTDEMLIELREALLPTKKIEERPKGKRVLTLTVALLAGILIFLGYLMWRYSERRNRTAGAIQPLLGPIGATSAGAPRWHSWIEESRPQNTDTDLVKVTNGFAYRIPVANSGVFRSCGPETLDQALRITWHSVDRGVRPELRLYCRVNADFSAYLGAQAYTRLWGIFYKEREIEDKSLILVPRSEGKNWGVTQTHEIRVVGDKVSFFTDGERRAFAPHAHHGSGRAGFYCNGAVVLEKVEWAVNIKE